MMTAFDAMARLTSFSLIAPTPRSMTRRLTSSPTSIRTRASSRASTEPDTSPLRISSSSWVSPFSIEAMKSSRVRRTRRLACMAARSRASRFSAICRAIRSSSTTRNLSPAPGTAVRPSTSTGRDGWPPRRGRRARRAWPAPGRTPDPPRSSRRPAACRAGPARSPPDHGPCRGSPRSRYPGRPVRVGPQVQRRVRGQDDGLEQPVDVEPGLRRDVDEHRVAAVLLGHQAVLGQLTAHLGRVGRLGTSILFTATTIGTSAARAWFSASIVCGITPSSAATTRMTMSVACAPRARMAVNAS